MLASSRKFALAVVFIITTAFIVADAQNSCTTLSGITGSCVQILTCSTITELLRTAPKPLSASVIQQVQQSHCGTFNNQVYVCCEPDRVVGGSPTAAPRSAPQPPVSGSDSKIRPSVLKSDSDVEAGRAILNAVKCGKSDADKVANGEDAVLSQYPWMALLVYSDGLDRSLDCGGSLISDRYVLTAAHCVRVGNKKLVSVRLGEHDTKQTLDCTDNGKTQRCAPPIQEIDIEEAIYHKDYNPSRFSDDIGLVRLISKVVFQTHIQPICLPITPQSLQFTFPQMIVAGWGGTTTELKASVLQKALVPIRENDFCQNIHKIIQITEKQLCAGGEKQTDTCKGDSGGPIFFASKYRLGARYIQYGILSAGSSKCGSNFPDVYVRVSAYLDWIFSNMRA